MPEEIARVALFLASDDRVLRQRDTHHRRRRIRMKVRGRNGAGDEARPVNWGRRLRFLALEKIALPAAIVPLRLLVRTWRAQGYDDPNFLAAMAAPRVLVATYHGMFLHLLAYAHIPPRHGRRLVVLISPSLDGRLLAATLTHFGCRPRLRHQQFTRYKRSRGSSLDGLRRETSALLRPMAPAGLAARRNRAYWK